MTDSVRIQARISNLGTGRAFWLRIVPAPGVSSSEWVLQPSQALPFLERGGSATLEALVHLRPRLQNPTAFETSVHLAVEQAYGEPVLLPPVKVRAAPPELEIQEVALLQDGNQRAITVTLKNRGSAIGGLAFRLNMASLSRVLELAPRSIGAGEEVNLSFGLDPGETLPPDARATLTGMTVAVGGTGFPIYDWVFEDLPVRTRASWLLFAAAAALFLALAAGLRYQSTYRNPAVVQLTSNPAALRDLELGDVRRAGRALKSASRLAPVLRAANVDPGWLEAATGLAEGGNAARTGTLAERLGVPLEAQPDGGFNLDLPPDFLLSLSRVSVRALGAWEAPNDIFNELSRAAEVTLALGATAAQRRELSGLARRRPSLLVAPDGFELTRLMLSPDPLDELARLIARYVPVTRISPYQTGGGVHRPGLFFGRGGVLAQVTGRDPANYLVVGGRQVGKSSLLKEVQRRFQDHPKTDCHYLVLTGDNGIAPLVAALGLPPSAGLGGLLQEFRLRGRRHTLFLVDEADVFVEAERKRGYETLQALRALSEEGLAHFMLAGFWSLYRQAALDYQSPLKNFGSVLTLGALEREACRALAKEPMDRLGVRWESDELVESLIDQTGQRANLISIACDEALYTLGTTDRTISAAGLESVLAGNRVRDALLGWAALSPSEEESRLDRIVVYATVDQESFTLSDLLASLEQAGYAADPESLKSSLARLELAFVLARRGNEYGYQVPLQRDLIRADDTRQLLRTEIRAAKA